MEYLLITTMRRQNFKKIYVLLLDKRVNNLVPTCQAEYGKLYFVKSIDVLVTTLSNSGETITDGSIAIFLYSISELVLRTSLRKAATAFQRLLAMTTNSMHHMHLYTFINSSLHNLSTISYLTAMVDAVVTIIPNDGTSISLEVAAEAHIVRRSQSSTKITEEIEMLEWRESRLHPRAQVRIVEAKVGEPQNATEEIPNEVKVFQKPHSRLITFESTDPEFDDDDDPDADLDL